jgi:hypothetical protein
MREILVDNNINAWLGALTCSTWHPALWILDMPSQSPQLHKPIFEISLLMHIYYYFYLFVWTLTNTKLMYKFTQHRLTNSVFKSLFYVSMNLYRTNNIASIIIEIIEGISLSSYISIYIKRIPSLWRKTRRWNFIFILVFEFMHGKIDFNLVNINLTLP